MALDEQKESRQKQQDRENALLAALQRAEQRAAAAEAKAKVAETIAEKATAGLESMRMERDDLQQKYESMKEENKKLTAGKILSEKVLTELLDRLIQELAKLGQLQELPAILKKELADLITSAAETQKDTLRLIKLLKLTEYIHEKSSEKMAALEKKASHELQKAKEDFVNTLARTTQGIERCQREHDKMSDVFEKAAQEVSATPETPAVQALKDIAEHAVIPDSVSSDGEPAQMPDLQKPAGRVVPENKQKTPVTNFGYPKKWKCRTCGRVNLVTEIQDAYRGAAVFLRDVASNLEDKCQEVNVEYRVFQCACGHRHAVFPKEASRPYSIAPGCQYSSGTIIACGTLVANGFPLNKTINTILGSNRLQTGTDSIGRAVHRWVDFAPPPDPEDEKDETSSSSDAPTEADCASQPAPEGKGVASCPSDASTEADSDPQPAPEEKDPLAFCGPGGYLLEAHRKIARDCTSIEVDETPVDVAQHNGKSQKQVKSASKQAYLVSVTSTPGADRPFCLYFPIDGRSATALGGVLPEFKAGKIISDGYGVYDHLENLLGRPVTHAVCWVHLRRRVLKALNIHALTAVANSEDGKERIKQQIQNESAAALVYGIVHGISKIYAAESLVKRKADEPHKAFLERVRENRAQHAKPLVDNIDQLFQRLAQTFATENNGRWYCKSKSPFAEVTVYYMNHRQEFHEFLDEPEIPPDTNLCEASIRPIAVYMKAADTKQSFAYLRSMGNWLSLVKTGKANGIRNIQQWLVDFHEAYFDYCHDEMLTRRAAEGSTSIHFHRIDRNVSESFNFEPWLAWNYAKREKQEDDESPSE